MSSSMSASRSSNESGHLLPSLMTPIRSVRESVSSRLLISNLLAASIFVLLFMCVRYLNNSTLHVICQAFHPTTFANSQISHNSFVYRTLHISKSFVYLEEYLDMKRVFTILALSLT